MTLTLTPKAATELKRLMAQRSLPDTALVRLGVAGGGCSGFEYRMDITTTADEHDDIVSESQGVRVAVDKKSSRFLDGVEIDYHEDLLKRGFVFNNPLATKTCGCGSSFQV
jgi:iron-sulfur cluster assembly protein